MPSFLYRLELRVHTGSFFGFQILRFFVSVLGVRVEGLVFRVRGARSRVVVVIIVCNYK